MADRNFGRVRARSYPKLAAAMAALGTASAAHGQTVLYVDDDAPAGGNGRSWGEAFRDLQDALWLASFVQGDIEIRVAQGIYTPDRGTGIREASFDIDNAMVGSAITMSFGMALRGAFAGVKALDPNERDPHRFKSVLSGDLNGDDQPGFVNYEDNSRHIVRLFEVNDSAIEFDGLVFRGGNADGDSGGALQDVVPSVNWPHFSIRDCTFIDNQADSGGALSLKRGRYIITGCFLGSNHARYGGGAIANRDSLTLTNCVVSGNTAGRKGGAIINEGNLDVYESTFYGNSADVSGGAIYGYRSREWVFNSIFFANEPQPFYGFRRYGVTGVTATARVTFSCVQGGFPGLGNIDGDPLFTDPLGPDGILGTPDDNFLPRFGSPVIDAGSNFEVYNPLNPDYAGHPRLVDDRFTPDTGAGTAPIVDMGAYEFQPPGCYADLDQTTGVGVLDLLDFLQFQHLFVLNDPYACQVDRSTGPNHCDIFDFLAFQSEFVRGCW